MHNNDEFAQREKIELYSVKIEYDCSIPLGIYHEVISAFFDKDYDVATDLIQELRLKGEIDSETYDYEVAETKFIEIDNFFKINKIPSPKTSIVRKL